MNLILLLSLVFIICLKLLKSYLSNLLFQNNPFYSYNIQKVSNNKKSSLIKHLLLLSVLCLFF